MDPPTKPSKNREQEGTKGQSKSQATTQTTQEAATKNEKMQHHLVVGFAVFCLFAYFIFVWLCVSLCSFWVFGLAPSMSCTFRFSHGGFGTGPELLRPGTKTEWLWEIGFRLVITSCDPLESDSGNQQPWHHTDFLLTQCRKLNGWRSVACQSRGSWEPSEGNPNPHLAGWFFVWCPWTIQPDRFNLRLLPI